MQWARELSRCVRDRCVSLQWRTESRVDVLRPDMLPVLRDAGLKVVDLGLETASCTQLSRMAKTRDPKSYLAKASRLLRACRDLGMWAKVNVLLYPGETRQTIAETHGWLEDHRDAIKGVSVGPAIVFRYGGATASVVREFARHGASLVDSGTIDRDGFAHIHLSKEISHEAAMSHSLEIARSLMTARNYFDLKSFSYLPRSLTWAGFQSLCSVTEKPPFSFELHCVEERHV